MYSYSELFDNLGFTIEKQKEKASCDILSIHKYQQLALQSFFSRRQIVGRTPTLASQLAYSPLSSLQTLHLPPVCVCLPQVVRGCNPTL